MSILRTLIVAFVCVMPGQEPTALTVAPSQIQSFVQQAVQDRLNAGDIPDFGALRNVHQLIVREEMPRAKQRLSKSALPERTSFAVSLRSLSEIQAEADTSNQDLPTLVIDLPQIDGDSASVWIGTDIVIHHQSERKISKQCCARGQAHFRREGATWVFVKWTGLVIS
jgi:hypothetical protein